MISLTQQGIQTERNKKIKIPMQVNQFKVCPKAIIIWKSEAQVLRRT
jgi:hypothetical protein